jgi:ADP-ribose pyrophosphatase YjhB (NUDIX family)
MTTIREARSFPDGYRCESRKGQSVNRQSSGVSLAGAIIEHPDHGFLLQLRDEAAPSFPLHWGLFGGHVEPGELPECALWRELREELAFSPHMALAWQLVQRNFRPNGGAQYIYHVVTRATEAELVLGEGKEMRFFRPDALPAAPYAANLAQILADHLAGRRDGAAQPTAAQGE